MSTMHAINSTILLLYNPLHLPSAAAKTWPCQIGARNWEPDRVFDNEMSHWSVSRAEAGCMQPGEFQSIRVRPIMNEKPTKGRGTRRTTRWNSGSIVLVSITQKIYCCKVLSADSLLLIISCPSRAACPLSGPIALLWLLIAVLLTIQSIADAGRPEVLDKWWVSVAWRHKRSPTRRWILSIFHSSHY